MNKNKAEFRLRFIRQINRRARVQQKGVVNAAKVYDAYVEDVGKTSDGTPEDDADYYFDNGGI